MTEILKEGENNLKETTMHYVVISDNVRKMHVQLYLAYQYYLVPMAYSNIIYVLFVWNIYGKRLSVYYML